MSRLIPGWPGAAQGRLGVLPHEQVLHADRRLAAPVVTISSDDAIFQLAEMDIEE